jgi:DNA-binding NarL/FixJ family response regulator
LEDEILALLRHLKEEHSHVRCLVLTQTERQHVMAVAARADVVLSRHGPTRELSRAVIQSHSSALR